MNRMFYVCVMLVVGYIGWWNLVRFWFVYFLMCFVKKVGGLWWVKILVKWVGWVKILLVKVIGWGKILVKRVGWVKILVKGEGELRY